MYYLYLKPICKSMLSQGKDQYEKDDRNFILDLNLLLLCSLFLFNFVVIVCIGTLIIRVIVTIYFHFTWMQVFSLIIVQGLVRCWLINFFRHKEHERNMVVHTFFRHLVRIQLQRSNTMKDLPFIYRNCDPFLEKNGWSFGLYPFPSTVCLLLILLY